MKKLLATVVSLLFVVTFYPALSEGAATCPDVEAAKGMLKQVTTKEGQASRALAGARTQVQAPRGQEVQAPRGQEVQAPRGQEIQAPRGQEVQAPRALAGAKQGPNIAKARTLINQAEAACKDGKTSVAASKAKEAMSLLK